MTDAWQTRVDGGDWGAITQEVNEYGGDRLPRLLTDDETRRIRDLYADERGIFRTTVGRGRIGGASRAGKISWPDTLDEWWRFC